MANAEEPVAVPAPAEEGAEKVESAVIDAIVGGDGDKKAEESGEGGAAAEEAAEGATGSLGEGEPVPNEQTIGYRTFPNGAAAYAYFQNLHYKLRKYQNLNEYEQHMVLELIKRGHPESDRKIGCGVKALQIRELERDGLTSSCFFILRTDGSVEDVSYRKCISSIFPEMATKLNGPMGNGKKRTREEESGRGRGARRGRGGRGRGSRGGRGGKS